MNGISEPLPGLLDDPQFQLPDLPALTDFHIAPLRDPAPPRHLNAPLPLEPVTENAINGARGSRPAPPPEPAEPKKAPYITPSDVLQARESKKPHLAISEIIEHNDGPGAPPVQLPFFVSLSVVEKSPVPASLAIGTTTQATKRPRLDPEADAAAHEFLRQLPRPPHKEQFLSRPAPLLPAMVTGLHEPPPSAGLLPSIDLDQPPAVARKGTAKIQVKDILMDVEVDASSAPSVKLPALPPLREPAGLSSKEDVPAVDATLPAPPLEKPVEIPPKGDSKEGHVKARRARRPWTEGEAQDLLRGVIKHGVGRWKQILEDPSFHFNDRTTVDLKDRHRVSMKDKDSLAAAATSASAPASVAVVVAAHTNTITTPNGSDHTRGGAADHSDAPPTSASTASTSHRRKRRAWTPGEDGRLIKGIQKHGFQWTNIHDDPELNLAHRRATDLRDRIRNKYPEGYRRAESAPLRSEVRKLEKPKVMKKRRADGSETASEGPRPREREKEGDRDKEKDKDQSNNAGLTLPSLTLDDDNDAMDWDNTLPPLLEWDDLGNMGV